MYYDCCIGIMAKTQRTCQGIIYIYSKSAFYILCEPKWVQTNRKNGTLSLYFRFGKQYSKDFL